MKYKDLQGFEGVSMASIFVEMCQDLGLELVLFTEIFLCICNCKQ